MKERLYQPKELQAAKELAIQEVHDVQTGSIIDAEIVLPGDQETLHLRRREIEKALQDGKPLYLCAYCSRPVYLALASLSKRAGLHFRHYREDGDCIARTRTGKTKDQIEALKYDGLKEGVLHQETKGLLIESLKCDSDFSNIETEKQWKHRDGTHWRRPDVRAMFRGQPIAFEIQLATTFLSVIEARSRFYLSEGARLVWIFRSFETENRPAAIDDIYFGNNRNAFVVSPETCHVSRASGKVFLQCSWPQPELRNGEIHEVWQEELVPFSSIRTDAHGREWYYDCNSERRKIRAGMLKERIRAYCVAHDSIPVEERGLHWENLVRDARQLGLGIPDSSGEQRFRKLMSALLSLQEGKTVGFGFPALVSVAHHIYDKHKPLLYYFLHAENAFGRRQELLAAGKPGVWLSRREDARRSMRKGAPCEPDKTYDDLVRALFPEIETMIDKTRQKHSSGFGGVADAE